MKAALKSHPIASKNLNPEKNLKTESSIKNAVIKAISAAIDQKGLDVRALDIGSVSSIADYFVMVSGTSVRHVQGIADKIRESLAPLGFEPQRASGYESGQWLLLDYGDFVAHIFYEPTRQYYEFDEFWKSGKLLKLPPELETQARRLRTRVF